MKGIGRFLTKAIKGADEAADDVAKQEGLSMSDIVQQSDQPVDLTAPPGQEPPSGAGPPGDPPADRPDWQPGGRDLGLRMPETLGGSTRKLPNADYFTNPDTQELIRLTQRAQNMREGKSWIETSATADALRIEELHGNPPNERWTAAEVTALRKNLEGQAQQIKVKTVEYSKIIDAGGKLSEPQVAEMQQMLDRLAATEDLISGAAHEAGQLLNALKIPIDSDYSQTRAIAKLVRDGGGPENMETRVQTIAKAETPEDILAASREGWGARTWKALLTWRYNMMLSSVRTHGANIFGSAGAGLYETAVVNNLKAVNDLIGSTLTGQERAYTFGDNWRGFTTSISSMGDAFRVARDIAAGRTSPEESGKFLNELGMRITPMRKLRDPTDPSAGHLPMTAWEKARLVGGSPTRLLESEDAFFRTVFYNQKLSELASAQARKTGDPKLYDHLMRHPPDAMRQEAINNAARLTFTNDPSIYGKLLGRFAKASIELQQVPGMQLIIPFVRTPANIISYTVDNMGLSPIVAPNKTYQALKGTDPAARADALARIEAGAGMLYLTHWMVNEGILTGVGSSDMSMRPMYEAQGWKPNSLCLGGTCVQLDRLDPLGIMLGVGASTWEIANEMGNTSDSALGVVAGSLLSMGDMMLDRSYLSTLGDLFDAIGQGASGGKILTSIASGTAASFATPGLARDVREMTDPYRREMAYPLTTDGLFNRIVMQVKNAYPIMSQGLANSVDVKGDLIINGGNFAVRGLLPVRVSKIDRDPVVAEWIHNNMPMRKPKEFIAMPKTSGRGGVSLLMYDPTNRLYAEYQAWIRQAQYGAAEQVIKNPGYQKLKDTGMSGTSDSEAAKVLRNAMSKAANAAKLKFLIALNKQKTLDSRLVKGEKIPVPHRMINMTTDLKDLITALKKGKRMRSTEIPGLMIKPSGGKNVPKMIAPEF